MKNWTPRYQQQQQNHLNQQIVREKEIVLEKQKPSLEGIVVWECLYGCGQKAQILHRGTGYCRACYDDKNKFGGLIN